MLFNIGRRNNVILSSVIVPTFRKTMHITQRMKKPTMTIITMMMVEGVADVAVVPSSDPKRVWVR